MDIITITQTLFRWGVLAFIGGITVGIVLTGIYCIYKKVFHGKKSVTAIQAVCAVLLCCWFILVFALTSLSRGANFDGSVNIDFLSGYISAWNHWSISELQLILFNMLMFTPLGFLLPMVWEKAEKLWVTFAVSFCLTAAIELFQFITGTGIFELDDLLHNVIGSVFGYFCIMAILTSMREKSIGFHSVGKVLIIPCFIGLVLGGAVFLYEQKPYGNMSILPAVKQDMSVVEIVKEWEPLEQNGTAAIYKNRFTQDKAYLQKIKSGLAALENLKFSNSTRREDENLGYLGKNANGTDCRIIFFFRTGEWNYTTFADNAAQLTKETVQQLRNRYENWMQNLGLLPENAEFSLQNGETLRWDVKPLKDYIVSSEPLQKGSVMIQFDETGELSNFFYQVTWNDYVATEEIISQSQAYVQVQQGNFAQYVPFQSGDQLYITNCELSYVYDTKGFYQPVYEFSGYINDSENMWTCQIPALI